MVDENKEPREEVSQTEHRTERSSQVNIGGNVAESNVVTGDNNRVTLTINRITQVIKNISLREYIIYTSIFLGGLLVIGYLFWHNNLRYDRTIASAQLNVLIVPFVEKNIWGYQKSDLGWTVAQIFADGMQQSFVSSGINTSVKILGPADRVPSIGGVNEVKLAHEAENVAEKINGQIVVYGIITKDDFGDSIVNVKFYISPTNFGEAQELISDSMMGELSLGSFRMTGNTVNGADLFAQNKELRDRLEIFSCIINFLGAYLGEDFTRAQEFIERAGNPDLWSNTNGLEVVELLNGNMEIRRTRVFLIQKDLEGAQTSIDLARTHFNAALDISLKNGRGHYARAYLGLAGVEGMAATAEANISGDPAAIDTDALGKVLILLDKAEQADYAPESADVSAKVNYNKAQVNLAYFTKTGDPRYLGEAQRYYQLVVDEFKKTGNQRIVDYAALSYSGLGLIASQAKQVDAAINDFKSALKLTRNPSLKVQCLVNMGDTYFANRMYDEALKSYQAALERKNDLENAVPKERVLEIQRRIDSINQR